MVRLGCKVFRGTWGMFRVLRWRRLVYKVDALCVRCAEVYFISRETEISDKPNVRDGS